MDILELEKEDYQGKPLVIRYYTRGYYDIVSTEAGFDIFYRQFDTEREKTIDDVFFSPWLENPVGYGAFEHGRMVGYVEGELETWNNRFRISNLGVFDESLRGKGLGSKLVERMLGLAKKTGARMAVLETQTCNERAITFYQKQGFRIIGFDLYAYGNEDPQHQEVRLEMGRFL